MKKIKIIFSMSLILIMVCSFVACSTNDTAKKDVDDMANNTKTEMPSLKPTIKPDVDGGVVGDMVDDVEDGVENLTKDVTGKNNNYTNTTKR